MLPGFGILLVIGAGLALLIDFTSFLGQFHAGIHSVSRSLNQSLHWLILGTTLIVIFWLFVSSLFHDPLLDPLGIEHRKNLWSGGPILRQCRGTMVID